MLGETPYWDRLGPVRSFVRSFDNKPDPRISRKPFDLESPNFTQTSTPTLSTAARIGRHYILPVGSYNEITVETTASNGCG